MFQRPRSGDKMFKNHKMVNKDKTENNKGFEVKDLYWKGFKEGKKQAIEEELKFLEDLLWILKDTVHKKVEDIINERIVQIKKEMKK